MYTTFKIYCKNNIDQTVQKTIKEHQAPKFNDDEEMTKDIREWSPFTSDFKVNYVLLLYNKTKQSKNLFNKFILENTPIC